MPDNWGDYDHWKTTDPREYDPVCERCGGNLRRAWPGMEWVCDDCHEEIEAEERELECRLHQLDQQPELEEIEP